MRINKMPANKLRRLCQTGLLMPLLLLSVAGSNIAWAKSAGPGSQLAYLRLTEGIWQIWLTDGTGSDHRQLTFDAVDKTRLSWSPDRKNILYNGNNGKLYQLALKTGESTVLPLPLTGMLDAVQSPDGQWLGFSLQSTHEQDNNDLWIMRLNGSGARKLVNQPGVSQMLSWSPSGDVLAYTQSENRENHQLWQLNIVSGDRQQLTVGDANYFDPSFGPTSRLAYVTNASGNYDIWIFDDDGKSVQITRHPAYDAQPAWSPNGNAIAFYSQRDRQRRIWVKNMETGKTQAVTPVGVASRLPVWR